MTIIDGVLTSATPCPSDNHNERPEGTEVSLLVIHNISLPAGCFGTGHIHRLFQNKLDCTADESFEELQGLEVAAHLLIERDGTVTQFVNFNQRAWHAGDSAFRGVEACNDYSIGIELEGCDDQPYELEQYNVLADIAAQLVLTYPAITPDRIAGHNDIAPGRKTDPGEAFDWSMFRRLLATRLIRAHLREHGSI
ncbi:AmpD protein [Sinobacterium caligoides]|uniref:1,6-anhydro-N-acetylmuramyl-L-alanine amidase AmpD n=1 Tax=Sinobacterium caligoides TaxID=933926 RepID=A0A3N2DZZ0_9GAMM|nr:1,6-anhydro-N-acetylmuramyl-L-alanine amidase AmpD [Sinobacterium caligoides]ROS05347.1 AmpD protein [Sinobacterium caligoides]